MKEFRACSSAKETVASKEIMPWRSYKSVEHIQLEPDNFNTENTTVWSFPNRGAWASHTPQYRGNWAPQVIRNIILLYSKPNSLVLDPMVGGGTTPVECLLTGRNSISVDINPAALNIVADRLDLPTERTIFLPKTSHRMYLGDTRNLDQIDDSSIDLIAVHPPYSNIIRYSNNIEDDLSALDYKQFVREFRKAIGEYYRVLKPGKMCAILIGDTHSHSHYVPLSACIMLDFLRCGFVLKEEIIKHEWNCKSNYYVQSYPNILLTKHEHLYVFRKPGEKDHFPNSSLELFI